MRNNKNNVAYLLHIRDAINQLTHYTKSHNFENFENNEWDQSAALRYLEIIGEAASKLEHSFQQKHTDIPWREIIALRNIVIHDYMNVDLSIIWKIMTKDIPKLDKDISQILDEK